MAINPLSEKATALLPASWAAMSNTIASDWSSPSRDPRHVEDDETTAVHQQGETLRRPATSRHSRRNRRPGR